MIAVFRAVLSILAGVALAFVLVIAVELISALVHPPPPDFGGTPDEMCQHVAKYPQWVLAVVVVAWGVTTYVSTWITRRIGNRGTGAFVGLFLLAAVTLNISMLPYPMWFKVSNLIVFPIAICLALRFPVHREAIHANAAK